MGNGTPDGTAGLKPRAIERHHYRDDSNLKIAMFVSQFSRRIPNGPGGSKVVLKGCWMQVRICRITILARDAAADLLQIAL
jgi:hypothetical protein